MIDKYSTMANTVLALVMAVTPQIIGSGSDSLIKQTYAEAQKKAEYIVATGDTSGLEQIDDALSDMRKYQKQLQAVAPVLEKIQQKFGKNIDLENIDMDNIDSLADPAATTEIEKSLTPD